ncbi:MAG: Xaa-Pro peptidase family protein [Paracoccaceae bacterium]|nr:Xaa-Pro peptidase family protein [Paracoccaceae bacterium]
MDKIEISAGEFAERRKRAADGAAARGLKGLLVCSRGGGTLDRFGDVYYLTNYYTSFPYIPDLRGAWNARAHAFVVLSADGECLLVTDAPNDGRTMLPEARVIYTDHVLDGVLKALQRLGMASGEIGLVGADVLPLKTYRTLEERLPGATWPDAQEVLAKLRAIKSPDEIALLRRASAVGSRAIEAMMEAAVPGASHGDVVAAGMAVLAPAGAALYNSFMASGRGGENPVAVRRNFPTWGADEALEDGQWFRIGLSGVVDGYYFDLSRSKAIGPPTNRQIELFEAAVEIIEAGIDAVRPGGTAAEVAAAGLGKQQALGYPNDGVFSGLGHGVGLGWDVPWLATGDDTVLEPGMVLCLERTIRKDGYLGDFEETVVVTEDGCEKITDARIRWW